MGIEDLSLDLKEYADKIILIAENQAVARQVGSLLESRSYNWTHVTTIDAAIQIASSELFDMTILCYTDESSDPLEALRVAKSERLLSRCPIILVHPTLENFEKIGWSKDDKLVMLKYPLDPALFLVKVTTLLRLRKFKADQTRLDSTVSEQNAQLRDLTNRFKAEVKEAQTIQKSILPKILPTDEKCLLAASYLPLEAVGGDLYDIWKLDETHIGFFIGDVTGHGLPAAFVGAMTKMALAYASKASPAIMLAEMNDGMADLMPEGRFVAVAAAIYDTQTGSLKLARGGQPNPFIWRNKSQTAEVASVRGMALGMVTGIQYQTFETTLEIGDKFIMLTDGITECTDMNGKMLGEQGVLEFFKQSAKDLRIDACLNHLLHLQDKFCSGRILKDDVTIIGLERV